VIEETVNVCLESTIAAEELKTGSYPEICAAHRAGIAQPLPEAVIRSLGREQRSQIHEGRDWERNAWR
jgi:hypothetical protein